MKLVRQLLEQWLPGAVCAQMSRTEVAVLWPGEEEKLEGLEGGAAFHIHGGALV